MTRRNSHGFSLVELLLVLAIIGIISGIAIPAFLGQRQRARIIGDARTNANQLAMLLETRRADYGIYATAGTTYTWTWNTAVTSLSVNAAATSQLPGFQPKGNSKMGYTVAVGSTGLTYLITVRDPSQKRDILTMTQTGSARVLVDY